MKSKWFILSSLAITLLAWSWSCGSSPTSSSGNYVPNRSGSGPTNTPGVTKVPPTLLSSLNTAYGPNGLAVGGGVTYVAEADSPGSSEMEVFSSTSPAGTTFSTITFDYLQSVACNSAGTTLFALEAGDELSDGVQDGTATVYGFTSAGTTFAAWTGYGSTPFYAPDALAMDAQGNAYVADSGNADVEEFGPTGSLITTWSAYNGTAFAAPYALAFDGSGNLYVGDYGPTTSTSDVVYEFSGNNSTGPTKTGANAWNMVPNCYMTGLAVDASGNLYVADYGDGTSDTGNGLVEVFAPNGGNVFQEWAPSNPTVFGANCLLYTGGNLLVGDWNNNLIDLFQ